MKIFVTGGTGGIGSFVTADLVAGGHHPVLYGRSLRTDLLDDLPEGSYSFIEGSTRDRRELTQAMAASGATRVIHMSAMLDACQLDPAEAVAVNLDATVNVLEGARACGMDRVVFTSSKRALGPITGVHGHPTYVPVTEDQVPRPQLMYDVTKFAAEVVGNNYTAIYGLPFVSLRFAQTYGPGKIGVGIVAQPAVRSEMIEGAFFGRPVRVSVGADARDDCVYARDIAQGIVKATVAPVLRERLYHLGTGKAVSLCDFADAIRSVIPDADIDVGPGLAERSDVAYPFQCVFDITRARRDLGYEPRYGLRAGVADYVEVMRRLGYRRDGESRR